MQDASHDLYCRGWVRLCSCWNFLGTWLDLVSSLDPSLEAVAWHCHTRYTRQPSSQLGIRMPSSIFKKIPSRCDAQKWSSECVLGCQVRLCFSLFLSLSVSLPQPPSAVTHCLMLPRFLVLCAVQHGGCMLWIQGGTPWRYWAAAVVDHSVIIASACGLHAACIPASALCCVLSRGGGVSQSTQPSCSVLLQTRIPHVQVLYSNHCTAFFSRAGCYSPIRVRQLAHNPCITTVALQHHAAVHLSCLSRLDLLQMLPQASFQAHSTDGLGTKASSAQSLRP